METNALQIQHADEYETRGQKAIAAVSGIDVVDEATNAQMGDLLSKVKQGMRTIESKVEEPITKAFELHRWLTGMRTKILAPWKEAEQIAKKRMADYQYKLMVIRREAEQKAEEERRRLDEERRRHAEALIAAQKPKEAAKALEKPVAPTTVVPELPKTEKQTAVFEYGWEVENLDLVPREFFMLNHPLISTKVRKEKLLCKIPGIKVIESAQIRSR